MVRCWQAWVLLQSRETRRRVHRRSRCRPRGSARARRQASSSCAADPPEATADEIEGHRSPAGSCTHVHHKFVACIRRHYELAVVLLLRRERKYARQPRAGARNGPPSKSWLIATPDCSNPEMQRMHRPRSRRLQPPSPESCRRAQGMRAGLPWRESVPVKLLAPILEACPRGPSHAGAYPSWKRPSTRHDAQRNGEQPLLHIQNRVRNAGGPGVSTPGPEDGGRVSIGYDVLPAERRRRYLGPGQPGRRKRLPGRTAEPGRSSAAPCTTASSKSLGRCLKVYTCVSWPGRPRCGWV